MVDRLRPEPGLLLRGEVADLRHRLNQISTKDLRSHLAAAEGRLDAGYVFGGTVYFTSSGTFTKADYPGLRAVTVKVQAGGGGGGGAAGAGSGESAVAGGGGGGGYTEKFILADDLSASETVTVGSGGNGGSAGANNGSSGGNSAFGSHCSADGGDGGNGASPSDTTWGWIYEGAGGSHSGGDWGMSGGAGGRAIRGPGAAITSLGFGGSSFFSPIQADWSNTGNGTNGTGGVGRGGGGAGAYSRNNDATNRPGGNGAGGIVLVELYY